MATCNICKYAGRPTYKSPCSECKEFIKYEYENKKTNADIIRSMSDEELANLIDSECDHCPPNGDCEKMSKDCKACWLNCLQSQAGKKLLKYIKSC